LKFYYRMDNASSALFDIAYKKAVFAAMFSEPTDILAPSFEAGAAGYGLQYVFQGLPLFGGGEPIFEAGERIGAVGCTGSLDPNNDTMIASRFANWIGNKNGSVESLTVPLVENTADAFFTSSQAVDILESASGLTSNPSSIVIVDAGARPYMFIREDYAPLGTIDVAFKVARAAVAFGFASATFQQYTFPDQSLFDIDACVKAPFIPGGNNITTPVGMYAIGISGTLSDPTTDAGIAGQSAGIYNYSYKAPVKTIHDQKAKIAAIALGASTGVSIGAIIGLIVYIIRLRRKMKW